MAAIRPTILRIIVLCGAITITIGWTNADGSRLCAAENQSQTSYQEYLRTHPKKGISRKAVEASKTKPVIPFVDLSVPIENLELKDGKIYKHVRIIYFSATTVTLSWDGGAATVPYDILPDDVRASAEVHRQGSAAEAKRKYAANKKEMKPRGPFHIDGYIRERTKGVIILESSSSPYSSRDPNDKSEIMHGFYALQKFPGYSQVGVRDNITGTVMRVGDFDSSWGQIPLVELR